MNLSVLKRRIDRANKALADELEQRAIAALWKLAKKHPGSVVEFVSAMGVYDLTVDRNECSMPVIKAFDSVCSDYGYNAIPAPIYARIKAGKLGRLTDWGSNPWAGSEVE